MRRIVPAAAVAAVAFVAPVQAQTPVSPPNPGPCTPKRAPYVAFGAFVDGTLTQTRGADTATRRDDRYSGTITVAVTWALPWSRADKGTQRTYALTDARVRLADRNHDGTRDEPAAGDRVLVVGRTTRLRRTCDQTGFQPTPTIRRVLLFPPQASVPSP